MGDLVRLLREGVLTERGRIQDFLPRGWMGSPLQSGGMFPGGFLPSMLRMAPQMMMQNPQAFIPNGGYAPPPGYGGNYGGYQPPQPPMSPGSAQQDWINYGNPGAGGQRNYGAGPAYNPRNYPRPEAGGNVVRPGPGAAGGTPSSMAGGNFAAKAPGIMQNLMRDFGLTDYQAAAIVGNIGHETGGFKYMQELKPVVPGSRGGTGWAQWTGSRRRDFENYTSQNNLDPRSDEANYGFLKSEIASKYGSTLDQLKQTRNPQDAMMTWEKGYEGSSAKHYDSRMNFTNQALQAYNSSQGQQPNQRQDTRTAQNPPQQQQQSQVGTRFSSAGQDLSHVNPDLLNAIRAGSEYLPQGYRVEMTSGYRDPDHNAQVGGASHSNHMSGNAVDVKIYDQNGNSIENRNAGPDSPYGTLARGMYHELSSTNPDLASHFRWGGNFNYHGFADSMHYDFHQNGDGGQLAGQYQQYASKDNFQQPKYLAQLDPRNQTQPQPQVASSQRPVQTASNQRPIAIGDSLAVGVGGIYGNTDYAHGGWNPQAVSGLVDRAIADGAIKGRPVVLSGGASNAGGDSGMVAQYYPQMIAKLQNAGASSVHVMGVGPYSHYDNYGYNKIIGDAASQAGVHFTGPLANIAPFSGNDYHGGIHPNDYRPIVQHVETQLAQPQAPTSAPVQTAAAQSPDKFLPQDRTQTQTAANTNTSSAPPASTGSSGPPPVSSGAGGSSSGGSSGGGASSGSGSSAGSSSKPLPGTTPAGTNLPANPPSSWTDKMMAHAEPHLKTGHRRLRERAMIGLLRPDK